jgi:hypothetical protein
VLPDVILTVAVEVFVAATTVEVSSATDNANADIGINIEKTNAKINAEIRFMDFFIFLFRSFHIKIYI